MALILLPACAAELEPFTADMEEPFAITGYLDTALDTQYVRVSALRRTLDPPAGPPGVGVTVTELPTGQAVAFEPVALPAASAEDSVVWVFRGVLRPQPGVRYRLEIADADGRTASAVTDVPEAPALLMAAADTARFEQRVIWVGVREAPFEPMLHWRVMLLGTSDTLAFSFPPLDGGVRTNTGWRYDLRLAQNRARLLQRVGDPAADTALVFVGLDMTVGQLSREWADPDGDHVKGGLGFWGAVGRTRRPVPLDSLMLDALGFAPP